MPRTSLSDLASLPDPLLTYNFDLFITGLSDFGLAMADWSIRCMTTALPGKQIDQVKVPLHGVEVNYMGRQVWSGTLQCTMHETRDNAVRTVMNSWMSLGRNNLQNSGNYKSTYARNAEIVLYDDIPTVVRTIKVVNLWPLSFDDLQLDGSQSTSAQYSCSFSYDWVEE
jgi:hypothetical protein